MKLEKSHQAHIQKGQVFCTGYSICKQQGERKQKDNSFVGYIYASCILSTKRNSTLQNYTVKVWMKSKHQVIPWMSELYCKSTFVIPYEVWNH